MNYKEALEYIDGVSWLGSKPGLDRVSELLELLGDPHKQLKFIHIAGTNGKGSCAAMTAAIMKACGYRTGLFISPYLFRFNERMQINGREIEDDVLADIVTRIQPYADKMEQHPTEFEMMTAAAMLWYAEEKCDIVVLEVGLGGRLDATNVIDCPECAVIMNIGLDHTAYLGDTVELIAAEKGGIIKQGADVVLYDQSRSVENVIRGICDERGAKLHTADFSKIVPEFDSLEGQVFSYKNEPYALPLLGANQLRNAATVLEIVSVLRNKGWAMDQSDVEHGLYSVSWPGRFEVLSDEPYFIADGGHNPQCAESVAENIKKYFPDTRRVFLVGILADKDFEDVMDILAAVADEFICVTPNSPRALAADALAEALRKYGKPVSAVDNIREGVAAAQDAAGSDGMVCATGSLYMIGEIRDCFGLK